ncbi:MAG: DUF2027 domain-containing protein [Paludibacteraceae bacterium]
MIKIGDNVRFLNSVGGGKVTKIDEKKNLVYVEDEDGFEIPALARDIILIQAVNEKTNFPLKESASKPKEQLIEIKVQEPKKTEQIIETAEGDTFKALLAFFPKDIKKMDTTSYECYLVNDSNYFLFYNFVSGENSNRKSVANGLIEPNMQEFLSEIDKSQLNDWEKLRVQIIPFKKDKAYSEQDVLDFTLKINVVRFYKLHSFIETDYFDDPCLLIDLTESRENRLLAEVTPSEIKQAMTQKVPEERRPRLVKKQSKNEIIEVDLHINSLLDTTAGMSNADMLNYQMDVFRKTLEENKNHKGQKIVFIHGKGEGVLRSEIEKELKTIYKNYPYQDASFREYGFGATMVTIK